MTKMIKTVCFSIFMILFVGAAFAGPDMNPGKWRITSETEMAGIVINIFGRNIKCGHNCHFFIGIITGITVLQGKESTEHLQPGQGNVRTSLLL